MKPTIEYKNSYQYTFFFLRKTFKDQLYTKLKPFYQNNIQQSLIDAKQKGAFE